MTQICGLKVWKHLKELTKGFRWSSLLPLNQSQFPIISKSLDTASKTDGGAVVVGGQPCVSRRFTLKLTEHSCYEVFQEASYKDRAVRGMLGAQSSILGWRKGEWILISYLD